MEALAVTFKKGENDEDFQIYLHPESLVKVVYDLQQEGMSDSEIAVEVSNIKAAILKDFKAKVASGEVDLPDTSESTGCGDPSCPNCGIGIVYH